MCKNLHTYSRRPELPYYSLSPLFAEYYCTISNFPFILLGLSKLYEDTCIPIFYYIYILIGICSSIHHAIIFKYSIIVDYIPISILFSMFFYHDVFSTLVFSTWIKIFLSILILLNDHFYKTISVPWGHVMWHLLASFSVDSALQDYEGYLLDEGLFE